MTSGAHDFRPTGQPASQKPPGKKGISDFTYGSILGFLTGFIFGVTALTLLLVYLWG